MDQAELVDVDRARRIRGDRAARADLKITCRIVHRSIQHDVSNGLECQLCRRSPIDVGGHGDVAVLNPVRAGIDDNVGRFQIADKLCDVQNGIVRRRRVDTATKGWFRAGIARDDNVAWIKQQRACAPLRGQCIDTASEGQRALSRHFHRPAVAALGTAARGNKAVKGGHIVRPQDDLSPVAGLACIRGNHRIRINTQIQRMGQGPLPHVIAPDADRATAVFAAGLDPCTGQFDLVANNGHIAAAAPRQRPLGRFHDDIGARRGGALGADPARHPDTSAVTATQNNRAIVHRDRARLGHARQVDGIARRIARRGRAHFDKPAFCRNRARVFDQRAHLVGVAFGGHFDLQETIARQIKGGPLAAPEPDTPHRHHHKPRV